MVRKKLTDDKKKDLRNKLIQLEYKKDRLQFSIIIYYSILISFIAGLVASFTVTRISNWNWQWDTLGLIIALFFVVWSVTIVIQYVPFTKAYFITIGETRDIKKQLNENNYAKTKQS